MARKRLNKNLVLMLSLVGFVVLVGAAALVLRKMQQRDPQYFVDLARQYEKNEEWETAAVFYKKAWARSHDATHLVSLADALLNTGDVDLAIVSLRQALVNAPDLTSAHLRYIEVLKEMASLNDRSLQWNALKDAAESFLGSKAERTDAQEATARHGLGLALTHLSAQDTGNTERGEDELRKAIELAPDTIDYAIDLVHFLINQERKEEGEQLYADLIKRYADPGRNASACRLAYADYLEKLGDHTRAGAYYQESIKLAGTDSQAVREANLGYANYLAAQWRRQSKDAPDSAEATALFDKAESILRKLVTDYPDEYKPYLALAALLRLADRNEEVVAVAQQRLDRGLSRKGIRATRNRFDAFQLMIYASRSATALAIEARDADDEKDRTQWLAKAEAYLADARGEIPNHPQVPAQAARIKLAQGRNRAALEDLRAAEEGYRAAGVVEWENKLTLARVHLKLNEAGAAVAVLESGMNTIGGLPNADANQILELYAKALLANKQPNHALAVAERILVTDPGEKEAIRIKAAALEQEGRRAEAGRLMTATGDPIVAALLNAEQSELEGNNEQALGELQKVLSDHPDDLRLVAATVRTLIRLDRRDEARSVVNKALELAPDDLKLKELSVLVREDLNDDERNDALLSVIKSQEDAYQRSVALVGFHMRAEQFPEALSAIDDALQHLDARDTVAARDATREQHRALLRTKLTIASKLDDQKAADEARDAAARENIDGAGGKTMLGLYHMLAGSLDLAVRAFQEALKLQPTDTRTLTYLGQCLFELGQKAEAQDRLEQAVQISPNDVRALKSLAIVAKDRGEMVLFEKTFRDCLRLLPNDAWVKEEALAQKEEANPHEGIARRQKLLEDDPDDVNNLIKLVDLCESVGDLAHGDAYCQRLLKLKPDDQGLAGAIGRYYQRTNRPDEALAVLTRFAESRPTPEQKANAYILLAAWHEKQNESGKVESTLLHALDIAETIDVHRALIEHYLLHSHEPQKALKSVQRAIELARATQPDVLPDLMVRRVVCVLDDSINDLPAAHLYVDELLELKPGYPQGLQLRAQIQIRSGEIDDAIETLGEYLRDNPNDYATRYLRAQHLIAQGRPQDAMDELLTIRRVDPKALDMKPRWLLSMLYRDTGKAQEWIHELESLVEDAPDSGVFLDALLDAYTKEKKYAEAQNIVTSRINQSQGQMAAGWLARRSHLAVALGNDQQAIADAQRAATLSQYTPQSVRLVLSIYGELKLYADGIGYYRRYLSGENADPSVRSYYAVLLADDGRMDDAVHEFRVAMRDAMQTGLASARTLPLDLALVFPKGEPAQRALRAFGAKAAPLELRRANERVVGILHRIQEEYAAAAENIRSLIDTATTDQQRTFLNRELGDVLQEAGDNAAACVAYEEAVKYDPKNWVAENNLAYLLADDLGKMEQAETHARSAVAIARNYATLDTLGWVLVHRSDFRGAVVPFNESLRIDPSHILSYYHLGEAYRRNEQWVDAENVLRRAQFLAQAASDEKTLAQIDRSLERLKDADARP